MTDKNQRDNIQVSIRIKPLLEESRSCIRLDQNLKNTIIIEGQQDPKYFYFDYVAQQEASQEDIFNIVGKQQAINCLDGYNGCVFVYGQTGSGKTYTMMGTQKQPGLLPRVIDFLFSCIDQSENVEYLLKCSYLEIYNEHIIDLLNPSLGNLQLREDLKKGVYVEQLSEEVCTNVNESLEVLQRGSLNRHISSTQMNIESSRSHSVFTIQLESRRQSSQTQVINHRFSRFHFVDLAGSERQKQSQVQGDRLREGCNINRSLHILGNVINSLVEDNQSYVHYRDSKLTFLLKDSLGGNSRTHLIANIQQSQQFFQETLSTLMFSKRVKQVKNKARINEDESGNLESLKNEIKRLKQELAKSVTQQQVWDSPKKFEQKSVVNEQFLQSLELESLIINDQRYIKLEEILKCYLEQSTESETALFLEIEKYLSGIKQLKEGFLLGQQLEQQLKFVIKLQNEQIAKLKQNQSAEDIQAQIQQQLSYALQCQGLVMKTFHENLTLREQQGCTQAVSKAQIQVDSNITLLKDIIETVQNSLNERRQFQQQLDQQFNSQYVTLEKFKQLESESEYKEQLLSEQTLKLVKMEEAIKETEKQFLQRLSENGITLDENDQIVDVRDKQIGDLKNRVSDLNIELTTQNQELENVLNTSESAINQLKTENLQLELQLNLKQDQINEQNTNLTNLKQQIDKMNKQIKQLESDNKNLEDNVKDIKQSLITEQNKNSQLSQQLNNEILEQKALIARKDNEIEDLQNQLREQIKKFEDSCNTVQEYVSIQQEQQASLELLEKQLESKQAVIQETSDHYNQVHELYIALQTRMEQKDQANGELRKEVNQQKSIIESLQKENQQKLTAIESDINQFQNSLNERRQFQQQLDQQFNSQYVTLEKFKQLESESEYKEQLLSEQTLKLVKMEEAIKETEKQFLQRLSENGITLDENDQIVDVRDKQIGDLKNRVSDLNIELTTQNQELENILNTSESAINQLKTENLQLELQLNLKQDQINEQNKNLTNQKQQIDKMDKQIKQLESDNKNLEDNVKDIKQSLITLQNKNSQLSQQLNNQILEQKALIARKDNEIEDLQNQLREQIKKFEDSCNTVQEYVSIQQEQQASLELLEKQLESKQAVIQETSDHYNQVHELYIALQTRMEQKDQANGELRKEVNQQKSIIESLQKENQQKLTAIESEYQQSRATLEIQQQGKLQDMTQKLQNKMKTIESLTIEKNSLNEKVRDLDCELNKYKLMNSNMELQIGEQQKLVQALQTQAQGLKNQLQDEKNQLEQLQSEYDQQSQSFDKNLELWKQETENLESENASFKIQLNEKQKELNKLEAALYQLQSTLAQRDSQIDELENQSEGQNQVQVQQIEQLSKENIQLKKQIQLMGQQIESQQEEIQAIKKEFDQKSVQAEESKQNVKKLTKQLDLEIKQYSTHMKKFDDQHKKEIQEVVDQLDILQKQLRMKEQVIEQLNKQLSGMQNAFETKDDITLQSQKEMQQLKDKLKSDQNKFTKIIQGLENANNLLKNQLDESTHLNSENVLKIQSGQKQYEMLNIQYNELQEKYTSLKDQMLRFESQIKQESQIREQYSHIADKVTKENNELKSKLDKKQQIITQLEQALLQNEETLKNVHDRAKDFCKQQEKEINDIKDQYLKLEAEHNAILSQNQEREDENEQIKDQKDQAVMQMQAIEEELMKTKRELSDQHEKLTKANNERSMLYKQIEEMQRDIAQLGGHNNPSQKIRYLNTIKQENSCLKQEKLYLSEQLQKEIEEKNKLLEKKKQTEQENQQNIAKLDMQKLVIENQRLNNEMSKLNQILNLSGIKNRYSTIKGSDGDKIIQSVQLLIQELIDCKQEIQLRNKEQEGKNLKYQTMEKDLLVMKQKFYAVQKDSGHQIQTKAQSPGVQPDVLRDNNRITINSGSVQRQSKPKGQQTFQFQ